MTRAFSEQYRIVRLDFPGFGASDPLPEPWSLEDYQDATAQFLRQLGLDHPVLVGHSFGGRVILRMCGNGLIQPEKIVLIDSAGLRPKRTLRGRARTACFKTAKWFLTHGPWKKRPHPCSSAFARILARPITTPRRPSCGRPLCGWSTRI